MTSVERNNPSAIQTRVIIIFYIRVVMKSIINYTRKQNKQFFWEQQFIKFRTYTYIFVYLIINELRSLNRKRVK